MKLIENIEELGNSIHDAVQSLIDEMFDKELSETEVDEIVSKLKLSDILILDTAYTNRDQTTVAKILGLELNEYSMGRTATSAASNRPTPGRKEAPADDQPSDAKGNNNVTQTNRNYNSGAQNAVTTTNIDDKDSDADIKNQEPLDENDSINNQNIIEMKKWLQVRAGIK